MQEKIRQGNGMKVIFYGTGGSCAAGSRERSRYGTNTSCSAVFIGGQAVVLDLGTGAVRMAEDFARRPPERVDILLSHYHYDHVDGFPFISPMLAEGRHATLYGQRRAGISPEQMMERLMSPPYFPVSAEIYRDKLAYREVETGEQFWLGKILVRTMELNHPGGATAYRLDWQGKSFAYLLDNEYHSAQEQPLAEFCRGVSLLVWDACFLESELERGDYKGWGHSMPLQGVRLAVLAGASRVALTHHAIWRTDQELDNIGREAKKMHHGAFVASDGMEIIL